ncbi:hypothetical protein Rhe02_16820 [Rhizocola hellebori]|uniref:WD40 repeat domain-containing protein n=1 Tax=Rhizocola hellebori TaxID=1392758 RepID=A0A8J3Q4D9_9ACTN|nr:DUF4303 domain-containing protein [Rhizocola hellebori]GIH03615.1 hypothetical protein Rhe02_16820 [Rhizocola hellebori]
MTAARLRQAYVDDLTRAWTTFRATYPDHNPYALVVYGMGCGDADLVPHVLTEQGLAEVAQDYVDGGHHDTLEEAREDLRYSVEDSPLAADFHELAAAGAVSAYLGSLDDEPDTDSAASAVIAALRELDRREFFGTGAVRDQLVLVILDEGDDELAQRSAIELNPPLVAQRFVEQIRTEGDYASCDTLAVAADGKRIYTAGSIANPQAGSGSHEEFLGQLVAYDLHGVSLIKRWAYEIPGWGDSFRQVACSGSAGTVYALRCQYLDSGARAVVMRFDAADGRLIDQGELPGEPASMAVMADGSEIAVSMFEGLLYQLDADLQAMDPIRLAQRAGGLRYLRGGELLIATDDGVLQLDPGSTLPRQVFPFRAFRLSTNDSETMLAVSQWPQIHGQDVEFGASVVPLPGLSPVRSFLLPDHQAVTAELSADGRRLALIALALNSARKHIIVFETETGQELIRLRADHLIGDLAFLPDGSALVVPTSGATTGPPLKILPIS